MENFIGIDIGGTKIDAVLLDRRGKILAETRYPTAANAGVEAVFQQLQQALSDLLDLQIPFSGVGIGCAGQVDGERGLIRHAVNLGWHDFPLVERLYSAFALDVPLKLSNDVNAAALGEWHLGSAQGEPNFVYLALGTGLGGAALVNGQLVRGMNHFAMEVGHLVIDPQGRPCKCGLRGCAEVYASGVGFLAGLAAHFPSYPQSSLHPDSSTSEVLQAAQSDDPLALKVLEEAGWALGRVMAFCASLYNPPLIVIGGGLGLASTDYLLPYAKQSLKSSVLPPAYEGLEIKKASISRIALGAASLAFE